MSYPRGPEASYGDDAHPKGSVKAARERAQAEQNQYLRADYYGQPSHPTLPMSQYNTRPQANPTPPSSSGQDRSRSPGANWPLPDDPDTAQDTAPRQKGPPPQRPPRPSYVPSILDPTKPQSTHLAPPPMPHTPARRREPEPEPLSPSEYDDVALSPTYYPEPNEQRRIMTASMASNSSLGSIPDFPIPNIPSSRKSQSLGPPPSARRGPSSYYSQMSYVSPIVEEAESHRSASHNSFASSCVIPSADGFYFDEDVTPSEYEMPMASPSTLGGSEDGHSSRATDDGDQAGLVRHASVGKRGKPSLTTIKSVDSFDKIIKANQRKEKNGGVGKGIMAAGAAGGAFAAGYGNSREAGQRSSSRPDSEALSNGTGLFPPSASASSESVNTMGMAAKPMRSSPLARSDSETPDSPVDPRVNQILGGLQKGGALGAGYNSSAKGSTLADRIGARRPPRLNMDTVRDAEARGSLTSLPDLIKRATRLASNLDRGKTASRLGLEMWEKGGGNAADRKAWEAAEQQRASTLSDILTSFPPPGIGTPTGERHNGGSRPNSYWPSALGQYEDNYDQDGKPQAGNKKQARRCCGMPIWCFVVLMTILFLLVAAAIVVPIVLIVLPKQNSNNAAASTVSQCQESFVCENSGSSVVDPSGHCSCMCVNGFTGDRCTTESDAGCTTTTIGGKNATIGSAMPSLISAAESSFSIALNGSELLSLFSSSNLSCTAENALVTFSGVSSNKRSIDLLPPAPVPVPEVALANNDEPAAYVRSTSCSSSAIPIVTAPPELKFLAVRDGYHTSSDDAATKYGIVFDSSPASSNSYSATATGTAAASATSSALTVSKKRLQFARIGVLFVLQESQDLSVAVTAQENLQSYFTEYNQGDDDATAATAVSLGNDFAIDLTEWHITLPNGTQVGDIVE